MWNSVLAQRWYKRKRFFRIFSSSRQQKYLVAYSLAVNALSYRCSSKRSRPRPFDGNFQAFSLLPPVAPTIYMLYSTKVTPGCRLFRNRPNQGAKSESKCFRTTWGKPAAKSDRPERTLSLQSECPQHIRDCRVAFLGFFFAGRRIAIPATVTTRTKQSQVIAQPDFRNRPECILWWCLLFSIPLCYRAQRQRVEEVSQQLFCNLQHVQRPEQWMSRVMRVLYGAAIRQYLCRVRMLELATEKTELKRVDEEMPRDARSMEKSLCLFRNWSVQYIECRRRDKNNCVPCTYGYKPLADFACGLKSVILFPWRCCYVNLIDANKRR